MNSEKNHIYKQIIKYIGIFSSIQGLSVLTGVIRNKITALLLGTEGMGMMSLLNTTVIFMSQATGLGLSFSGVREIAACKERGDQEMCCCNKGMDNTHGNYRCGGVYIVV